MRAALVDVILFCFAQATADAMSKGKLGVGGSSSWRDAQAVIWVIAHELKSGAYSKGQIKLR